MFESFNRRRAVSPPFARRTLRVLGIASALAAGCFLMPREASAHNEHGDPTSEDFFRSCAEHVGSMPIDSRLPYGKISAKIHPRWDGGEQGTTCESLNWVSFTRKLAWVNVGWAGRTAKNDHDCNHSTLAYGLYKKVGGSWTYLGGFFSFGNPVAGACNYDKTAFPAQVNWGELFRTTDSSVKAEYRIGFYAWSHDDPAIGHFNNDCADPKNCSWGISLLIGDVEARRTPRQDLTIWRPSDGKWWVKDSDSNAQLTQQWGMVQDQPVGADYDGDYQSDFAVARRNGAKLTWYVINSQTGATWSLDWGQSTDLPVYGGDFDGDGRADIVAYTPQTGNWSVVRSNTWVSQAQQWGSPGDIPLAADYDGDRKSDFTVFRPSDGNWHTIMSTTGAVRSMGWGLNGDIPITGDQDGDGRADVAVYRPTEGRFYWCLSSNGTCWTDTFGQSIDIPQLTHMDNDWKTDATVFRPNEARWYSRLSTTGAITWSKWGDPWDKPARAFSRNNN